MPIIRNKIILQADPARIRPYRSRTVTYYDMAYGVTGSLDMWVCRTSSGLVRVEISEVGKVSYVKYFKRKYGLTRKDTEFFVKDYLYNTKTWRKLKA